MYVCMYIYIENAENNFIEICKITYNDVFCRRLEGKDVQKLNYNFEREGEYENLRELQREVVNSLCLLL